MSEIQPAVVAKLWVAGEGFRDDEWIHAESGEALAGNRRVILPLDAFLSLDPERRAASIGRIGVHVQPGEAIELLLPYVEALPLISLAFPAFSDGRSYSKAELLRTRHGYRGTIRASGDVLIDQIPLMIRTGFNEFAVSNATALKRLAQGRFAGLPFHYQPTGKTNELAGARYSWRRLPAD